MMTDEQIGRLLALAERTHEDVREIKQAQVRQWVEIDKLRVTTERHKVHIKIIASLFGGGSVAAAATATVGRILAW
jgi:hypothetical protein